MVMRALLGKFAVVSLLAGVVAFWSFDALAGDEAAAALPKRERRCRYRPCGRGCQSQCSVHRRRQSNLHQRQGDTVPACMTCHGAGGWGLDAMGAPRLAGIGYPYVVKELSDLASGKRTPSGAGAVMVVFAGGLTEQERRDVAGYVNTLDGPPDLSDLKALKEGGTTIGEGYSARRS